MGRVSPQYHVVFDDKNVKDMEEGTVPQNWSDLVKYSSELTTKQEYKPAETWLEQSCSNSDLLPMDNPVSDPFAIVPDHHAKSK